ncbi:Phosphotransferase enzyme family protein [Rhodobacteraceae bacterium THAF1]|uniref:aminoglycoside phosphotransferase family protein n=1 Tax=Palleronia sp. THAF1 TaxID=2587842 RepID=UPI000F401E4B|nr:phosphotransferase [Palleronia sp. THAF1]QFU10136.1 Phosphotransferase enzyme family protein [Palleronia sp. THAF1]VDC16959.1 Phosphotransferase enzyme family protein [Rhodobacteraceae bacterium THAF1]
MIPAAFLAATGWSDATATPLAGDASSRSYTRLAQNGESAILMRANGTPLFPFLRVAEHLRGIGLSPPTILAESDDMLLIEDLGDAVFARLIAADASREHPLYEAATDLLVTLQNAALPEYLAPYGPTQMAAALEPCWTYYTRCDGAHINRIFRDLLESHAPETTALLHRDYHAENLIWLPDRTGPARVGLLDFQDALAGHPSYDLASLLQDARRDVSADLEEAMIERFCTTTDCDPDAFRAAYALQSVQRHLRILGIFTHLADERGKPGYLALIPRVRGYLDRCLAHPVCESLRAPLAELLP